MFQKNNNFYKENEQHEFPQLQFQMDPIKSSCHHQITLENVPILFPQNPYVVQQQYMKSVILALNSQSNALLQSPTGTGKTLALLCATLAWTHQCKKKIKIIYSSRTHSQLQQVANELSKTAYKPRLSMLGSRNQLCINNLINKIEGTDLDKKCSKLRSKVGCQYYQQNRIQMAAQQLQNQVLDIEDFKSYCKDNNICPFYLERQRNDNADIILLPYNYLLTRKLKGYLNIQDCIIIFDEAHNVVQAAEDGQSFSLSQQNIIKGEQKLQKWIQEMKKQGPDNMDYKDTSQLNHIAVNLNRLQNHLNQFLNSFQVKSNDQYCRSLNARIIIKILQYYFSFTQIYQDDNYLTNIVSEYLPQQSITDEELEQYESYCAYMFTSIKQFKNHPGTHLKNLLYFFDSINQLFCKSKLQSNERQLIDSYKLFIEKSDDKQITLTMNCLDPSIGFQHLINKQVYSIIITSGTLTPFDSWPEELSIQFKVPPLENGHLDGITNNVKGFVLKEFNFSYQHRNDERQLVNLGNIIIQLCDVVPGGMLVVFSSYQIMNMIKVAWNDYQILHELVNKKALYWEPANMKNLQAVFSQYQQDAKKKGAILFCVQRGKVSEGIDFSDELCRAVFLIGVPFLPAHELKVIEKKKFIDSKCNSLKSNAWYMQQAIRCVNQALGRVIRHKNDYGAIFLCDSRFQTSKLSKWVQPSIQKIPQWKLNYCKEIHDFFQQKAAQYQQQDELEKKIKINEKE